MPRHFHSAGQGARWGLAAFPAPDVMKQQTYIYITQLQKMFASARGSRISTDVKEPLLKKKTLKILPEKSHKKCV